MVKPENLEGKSHLTPLTLDLELQDSFCTLLGFSSSLVQYSLSMLPFSS